MSAIELTVVEPATIAVAPQADGLWLRRAKQARLLSWVSLLWVTAEGVLGLAAGITAGSIALIGFGLSSVVEGLASVIVIWRFTGDRTHSETSELRAQRMVAISFFIFAPYVAIDSVIRLLSQQEAARSWLGIAVVATSIVLMPVLGLAKRRLGEQLGSGATAGEGTQNLLCALTAVAVLIGLVANDLFGAWWLDPVAGLFIAGIAVHEGREMWHGRGCCAPQVPGGACADDCCD